MQNAGMRPSRYTLREHGLGNLQIAYWNLPVAQLIEKALERQEGLLAEGGALVVRTGQFTGRSPKDKYIVKETGTASTVDWGPVNQPMSEQHFDGLLAKVQAFLQGREVFVQDCFGGAGDKHKLPIRVITQRAWQSLFARQLFVRHTDPAALEHHVPEFTLLFAPDYQANPAEDGTNSETCIALNFKRKM